MRPGAFGHGRSRRAGTAWPRAGRSRGSGPRSAAVGARTRLPAQAPPRVSGARGERGARIRRRARRIRRDGVPELLLVERIVSAGLERPVDDGGLPRRVVDALPSGPGPQRAALEGGQGGHRARIAARARAKATAMATARTTTSCRIGLDSFSRSSWDFILRWQLGQSKRACGRACDSHGAFARGCRSAGSFGGKHRAARAA